MASINTGRPMSVAGTVIVAVVVITLLGALAATFLGAANDVAEAIENSTWTNTTIGQIVPALGLLVGIGLLLGFVALALNAFDRGSGGT